MGLPVFPDICAGLLPMVIINVVMSVALIKHALQSFFQVLGLLRKAPPAPMRDAISQTTVDFICPSLVLPGYIDEIRGTLPLMVYSPGLETSLDLVDTECPVCLCKFQKDQEIRVLPHCKHVFHRGCLDQWLQHQHTTCPLCRISLVPEDISRKWWQREQEISEDISFWISSSHHGSGFHGLWCHL